MYTVPVHLRIEKDVIIRVNRILQGKGQLQVNIGQEVTPDEIIGSASISSGFRTLNLSSLLGVPPKEVEEYLNRNIGQRIYKGELLASKKGWLLRGKNLVISPADGILDFLDPRTGELKITFLPKKADLPAGVYGIIEQADQEKGQVVIRTQVSQVHGVFGSGRPRDGLLSILGKNDDLISKAKILAEHEKQILVAGSLIDKSAVSAAISYGVFGIITGGINAGDFRRMTGGRLIFPRKLENDSGVSVVVCEGFGSIPLGLDIFEVLSEYEGRFVFIDGNKALINLPSTSSSSLTRVKNTKLPALRAGATTENDYPRAMSELKIGLKVRIIGNAYYGERGVILAIDSSSTLLPSRVKACMATVETARRKIQVPIANLEVIV